VSGARNTGRGERVLAAACACSNTLSIQATVRTGYIFARVCCVFLLFKPSWFSLFVPVNVTCRELLSSHASRELMAAMSRSHAAIPTSMRLS